MMIKEKFSELFSGDSYARGGIQVPRIKNWRQQFFQQMLKILAMFGLFVVIPSAWLLFRVGLFGLGLFGILAYLLVVTLFFARGLGYQPRAALFLLLSFAVGFFVLTETGVSVAVFIWLFIVPAMGSLLLGLRGGMIFLGLNILVTLGLGYSIYLGSAPFRGLADFDLASWSVTGINFLIANLVISIPLGALLDSLLRSEEEIEDVRALNERILSTAPVGIAVYKIETGNCVVANQSAADMVGGSIEALMKLNFYEIQSWKDSGLLDAAKEAIQTNQNQRTEIQTVSTFGKAIFLQCQFATLSMGGQSLLMLTASDISPIKLAEKEMAAQLADLNTINQVSSALQEADDLEEMLALLLDTVIDSFSLETGSIWLYDSFQNAVRLEVSRGYTDETGQEVDFQPEKPGTGFAGAVFASGEVFISNEHHIDKRIPQEVRKHIPAKVGGVVVPIRSENKVIGVIAINTLLPQKADEINIGLLTTLANLAGNAIQRISLHEQTRRGLHKLIALSEIDRVILSSNDLTKTLNTVLDTIRTSLDVDAVGVLLLNKESSMLEYAAGQGFQNPDFAAGTVIALGEGYAGQAAKSRRLLHVANLQERQDNPDLTESLRDETFVEYLALPLLAKGDLIGVLEIYQCTALEADAEWLDFLRTLAGQASIAIENATLLADLQGSNIELRQAYDSTIEGWSHALDLRDQETEGHSQRVAELTVKLAGKLGASDEEIVHMRRGALLHDIGKMGIPDNILLKPDKLSKDEWGVMKKHPVYARDMLHSVMYLRKALEIPYTHHEKWDGSGYPRGLKGEDIPFAARIFAVVDVFDALTSDRPYRDAWPVDKAIDYVRSESGKHFDPKSVNAFLELFESQNENGRDAIIAAWQKQV